MKCWAIGSFRMAFLRKLCNYSPDWYPLKNHYLSHKFSKAITIVVDCLHFRFLSEDFWLNLVTFIVLKLWLFKGQYHSISLVSWELWANYIYATQTNANYSILTHQFLFWNLLISLIELGITIACLQHFAPLPCHFIFANDLIVLLAISIPSRSFVVPRTWYTNPWHLTIELLTN